MFYVLEGFALADLWFIDDDHVCKDIKRQQLEIDECLRELDRLNNNINNIKKSMMEK